MEKFWGQIVVLGLWLNYGGRGALPKLLGVHSPLTIPAVPPWLGSEARVSAGFHIFALN